MDTEKLVIHCDACKADMGLVTGRTCFGERYSRYECPCCGNAVEAAVAAAQAVHRKAA